MKMTIFKRRLLLIAVLFAPAAAPARHAVTSVEIPTWSRSYVGHIGTKPVKVALSRVGNTISGTYCYGANCYVEASHLSLTGALVTRTAADIKEIDYGSRQPGAFPTTGNWSLNFSGAAATGVWSAPRGGRKLRVSLVETNAFPFEIRLVAPDEKTSGAGRDICTIRLYKNKKLVQSLEAGSERTCGSKAPWIVDANFDGALDLAISAYSGNGANQTYSFWLFNKAKGRFNNPDELLESVANPFFDPIHRLVASDWRNGCCEHGVTLYRWHGTELRESETASSYFEAIAVGPTTRYCYVIPGYFEGHILAPGAVQQDARGRLSVNIADPAHTCDENPASAGRVELKVWKTDANGAPVLVHNETGAWKLTQTPDGPLYCWEEPVFVTDHIERRLAPSDITPCEKHNPNEQ